MGCATRLAGTSSCLPGWLFDKQSSSWGGSTGAVKVLLIEVKVMLNSRNRSRKGWVGSRYVKGECW